jgi:hypothetical protein
MSNPLKTHQNTLVSGNKIAFGELRKFEVSHRLFLEIKGGQAVFIFI